MDKIRVFVATTAGPSEVVGLTEEDSSLHSVVCLGGSEFDLPISPSYHRFVRDPTGIIERHFGHPAWRMDVSDRIEVGDSWKLGIVAAHSLHAAGRLATGGDPAARHAIWLTGAVSRDLSVGQVGHIPDKLARSSTLFARLREQGVAIRIFMPAADAAELNPEIPGSVGADDLTINAVHSVDEMTTALELPPLARAERSAVQAGRPAKTIVLPQGIDFTPYVAEKMRDFVGREWLLDHVHRRLDGDDRALLVTGDPGAGKSAFAAKLIDAGANGMPSQGSRVAAYFCCQADSPATVDPAQFVRTLAAMLGGWHDAVDDALRQAGPSEFLNPSAVSADPVSAFDLGILAPLSHVTAPDRSHAIVIDGLDEALAATDGRISIADLVARRIDRFPAWLKLIVTGRPLPRILSAYAAAHRIDIGREDARNVTDIRRYVREKAGALGVDGGASAQRIEEQVVARSDGNMLCARQIIDMLARSGDALDDAADLPPGLAGVYQQSFARTWPTEQSYWPVRNVLASLIAAREPLSLAQLAGIAAANGDVMAANTIDALEGYVRQVGNRLAIYHQSLVEWLTAEDRASNMYWIDRRSGLSRILAYCRQWRSTDDVYPLFHFSAHLRAVGAVDELAALMESGEFVTAKTARSTGAAAVRDDYRNLGAALLSVGRDADVVALARTADVACRDGIQSALAAAGLRADRAERIAAGIVGGRDARRSQPGAAELNGWRVAVAMACDHGLDATVSRAANHASGLVRAAVVPPLYRLWQQDPEKGWAILDGLVGQMTSRLGMPRAGVFEVVGGVSLAILGWHYGDAQAMTRLQQLWQRFAHDLATSPIARIGGRGRIVALLVSVLQLVMSRQPAYQPLNLAELTATFARPPAARHPTLQVIDCLEEPERGPDPIIDVLSKAGAPFDVHLMLAAERALILYGDRDPVAGMNTLRRLHETGCPWFRQSVLYAGFHMLKDCPQAHRDLADGYLAMATETISEHSATFTTESGTYFLVPHMAWPEIVLHRHWPAAGARFLPPRLAEALERDDMEYAGRVIRACGILSLAYRHHALALDALRAQVAASDVRLQDQLCETLANIRFVDEVRVDEFMRQYAPAWLADRVVATTPTVTAADFPTWIDAFFVHLLRTSPPFRREVVAAFRRAVEARSLGALMHQVVPWMLNLVRADDPTPAQPH